MKITLRQLQIFLAVAQSGSTTAAAGMVALSQSAASAALNELEHLLGVQLFDRVGKRLILNDSGRQLLPQARHMLDAAQTIERQFADPEAGSELHIGASTTIGSYLLPAMIAAYRKQHAGARVRALVANTADIVDAVAQHRVLAARVKVYQRVSQRRWNLILDDGVLVKLPENGWQKELDALDHLVVDKGILERDVSEIDLRSPTQYFFVLRNGEKRNEPRGNAA